MLQTEMKNHLETYQNEKKFKDKNTGENGNLETLWKTFKELLTIIAEVVCGNLF